MLLKIHFGFDTINRVTSIVSSEVVCLADIESILITIDNGGFNIFLSSSNIR